MAEPLNPTIPVTGQNPDVAWAIGDLKARLPVLLRRRAYREGRHLPVIPPAHTLSPLVAALLDDLADNMCDDVVEEPASRLEVVNWTEPEDNGAGDAQDPTPTAAGRGQLAQDKWEQCRGPAREESMWCELFGQADLFAIAEKPADDKPSWFSVVPAEQMCVRYRTDAPDVLEVAARLWLDGGRYRLNLYYGPDDNGPGRLERWASKGKSPGGGIPEPRAFTPYTDPGDPEDDGTREAWTRIPVFHLPHRAVGRYGTSVLTPVIPLQDLLNKAVADLVVNMEAAALPDRFGTGIQARIDPATGTELPVYTRHRQYGAMPVTASKDANVVQFPAADMQPFMDVIKGWRLEIARKGYLPLSSVERGTGGPATGLGMLVDEGRMVKRVKTVHRDGGAFLRELMAFLLTLDGIETFAEDLDLEWANPGTRDEQAMVELALLKRDLGVPPDVYLPELGYDPGEVDAWLENADTMTGGRVSQPGPGIASVTVPGVPGGFAAGQVPMQPAGAATPGVPGA